MTQNCRRWLKKTARQIGGFVLKSSLLLGVVGGACVALWSPLRAPHPTFPPLKQFSPFNVALQEGYPAPPTSSESADATVTPDAEKQNVSASPDRIPAETDATKLTPPAPPDSSVTPSPTQPQESESGELPAEETSMARLTPPAPGGVKWNPDEYELLRQDALATSDVLAALPPGFVTPPAKPLSLEELLAANRPEQDVTYLLPKGSYGDPKKNFDQAVREFAPLPPGQIVVESTDYLDFDEEHHQIYGSGRVTARYGVYKLEADRMLVDTLLKDVQAYGNVVLTTLSDHVEAESMWISTETGQGVAYGARGRSGPFYFLGEPFKGDGKVTFRQLSKDESLLKNASFTTCDFPVPHYRLRAREFVVYNNDRVFGRNVVLYIMEKPVLWLPYFTMALRESNPWGFTLGSDSKLGAFLRVWYDYYHATYAPSKIDDETMVAEDKQRARLYVDWFSKRGKGLGLNYTYSLDYGRHQGKLKVYGLSDNDRNVDPTSRYGIDWYNRTRLTERLSWLLDVDWQSDPDLFFDVIDRMRAATERRRDRLPERRFSTGLEYTTDNFFAGLLVEIKDRIGRDRVTNFAEPLDNDYDYDRGYNDERFVRLAPPATIGTVPVPSDGLYTDPTSIKDENLDDGLDPKRYGRVTQRMPQVTISSNRMRLWTLPLWYHVDLNVFNNLDKGLNTVSTKDDSFVTGFDLYQSLSHLLKFCERYTLLTKVGLGVGIAERNDDSFNLDFPAGATFPFVYDGQRIGDTITGVTFLDRDTFLVGRRKFSLKNVQPAFVYGDIDSRFNARITDALTAWIRYRYREGTKDSLGEFYEGIGSRKTRDDLYPFRLREHWIEAGLNYLVYRPNLNATFSIGHNLQGRSDITPNELLRYANLGVGWTNARNTLTLNGGISLQERQMRDPTDPNEFQQSSLSTYIGGTYRPVHNRYYTRLTLYQTSPQNNDPLGISGKDTLDLRDETVVDFTYGRRIGSKYMVEYSNRYRSRESGVTEQYLRVTRDFHDLVAGLELRVDDKGLDPDKESSTKKDYQVRLHFRLKMAGEKGPTPIRKTDTLFSRSKLGAFETGG